MQRIRTFLSSATSTSTNMGSFKTKTPPAPTVPSAIKSREEVEKNSVGEGSGETETAVFANGCFWGTEHFFRMYYSHLPKFEVYSGYAGGHVANPSYRQVCSSSTGHAESVSLTYAKGSVGYAELVEFFYRTHDSTTVDRQGPDRGSQYRSAIFATTPEQLTIAQQVTKEVQEAHIGKGKIVTEIKALDKFYKAEENHQMYLINNESGYHCPSHYLYW